MKAFLYVTLVILMLLLAACASFDGMTMQVGVSLCCAAAMGIVGMVDCLLLDRHIH